MDTKRSSLFVEKLILGWRKKGGFYSDNKPENERLNDDNKKNSI